MSSTAVLWMLAILVVLASVALLVGWAFERRIGLRYLARLGQPARTGAALAAAVVALGAGGLLVALDASEPGAAGLAGGALLLGGSVLALAALMLRRLSVFTTISTLGLALGISALVVVLAVTRGFERDYLYRLTTFHGHLMVGLYGEPSSGDAAAEMRKLEAQLADLPGLVHMEPLAISAAEILLGRTGANLKAVDPIRARSSLGAWMVEGDLADLSRPASCPGVEGPVGRMILGAELARRGKAKPGDCVWVLVPFSARDKLNPISVPFQVVGTFRLGYHAHDARLAIIPFADVAAIERDRPFIYGVQIELADPFDAVALAPRVQARVGESYRVLDWRRLSQGIFDSLATQRVVIGLFLLMIVIVSAFNLVASLTMVVLSKARQLAILSVLGARRGALSRTFVVAGASIGLLASGTGLALGLGMCALLRGLRYPLDASIYLVDHLPVSVWGADLALVVGLAQVACLLATVPPVRRLRRLALVELLHR